MTPAHKSLIETLRPHDGKTAPPDTTLAFKIGVTEREVASLLADLSDWGKIKINRQGGGRRIAVFALMPDVTDDISRRIQEAKGEVEPVAVALQRALGPVAARKPAPPPVAKPVARRWPATKGMPPSIENRHPTELKIDDSYQRSTDTGPSRALIRKIANGWDWRMCMPLVVSKREDGSLWVIDGQHRLAAALMRGDIPFLPCCVGVYAGVADEAAMFVAMNRARRAMNRLDDFHAAQAGADPDAMAVAALITTAGFTVSRKTGSAAWAPGEVAFTSAIAKVRRRWGDEIAANALALLAEAFPGQRLVAGSSVFTATCSVLADPPAEFDRARLLAALRTFDMAGWASFLSDSKGGTDRAKSLREMLLAAYADVEQAA